MHTFIPTFTGGRFDILNPCASDIHIMDIAFGLARERRWAGQTATVLALSVAEHSIRVSRRLPPELRLAGLMHDAHEGLGLRDMPTPFKQCMPSYEELENRAMRAIFTAFDLPWPMPPEVKAADDFMAHWEARDLMKPAYEMPDAPPDLPDERLPEPMSEIAARIAFLDRFNELVALE
jgi:5'-nucleotidase